MRATEPSCAIVIPVYNAGGTAREIVAGVCEETTALGLSLEQVIVVDDGCSDGSSDGFESLGVTVLRHSRNRGKGAALRTGFAEALRRGVSRVVTLDADGQHRPEDLPRFLEHHDSTETMLMGERADVCKAAPLPNRLGNRMSRALLQMLLKRDWKDVQCGYRRYPASLLKEVRPRGDRYEFETELLVLAVRRGYAVETVPVATVYLPPEQRVSHFRRFADSVAFIVTVLRLMLRRDGEVVDSQG